MPSVFGLTWIRYDSRLVIHRSLPNKSCDSSKNQGSARGCHAKAPRHCRVYTPESNGAISSLDSRKIQCRTADGPSDGHQPRDCNAGQWPSPSDFGEAVTAKPSKRQRPGAIGRAGESLGRDDFSSAARSRAALFKPLNAQGGACARAGNGCRTGRTAAPS
jgi:hypothetical protein